MTAVPGPGCTVCASGVTSPHGAAAVTPGHADMAALIRAAQAADYASRPVADEPEAAFASGARVRTAPCTVDGHDREHFQVRTNRHWLCGHLLASLLITQGIVADPEAQPASELAAAMAALATEIETAGCTGMGGAREIARRIRAALPS